MPENTPTPAERPDEVRRRKCVDCGVRLYNAHRGMKHAAKTGHRVVINNRAERATLRHLSRVNPGYQMRLAAMDRRLNPSRIEREVQQ